MPVPRFAPRQSIARQAQRAYQPQAVEDKDNTNARESGSPANTGPLTPANILAMQQTVGNQAVLRRIAGNNKQPAPGVIQRKMALTGATRTNFYLLVAGTDGGPFNTTFKQLNDYLKLYQGAKNTAEETKYLNKMQPVVKEWLKKNASPKAGSRDAKKQKVLVDLDNMIGDELNWLRKNQSLRDIGLPQSLIEELKPAEFTYLMDANQAAREGKMNEADQHLAKLARTRGGAVKLIRSNIVRANIDKVDPTLAASINDDKFKVSDQQSGQGAQHVQQLADQLLASYKADPKAFEAQHGKKMAGDTQALSDELMMGMKGFKQAPLKNLESAGKDLQTPGKVKQTGTNFSNDAKASMQSLTGNEMTVLVGYTSNLYSGFSDPLRNDVGKKGFGNGNLALTQTAISAMNKFKSYTGKVYRHDRIFDGFEELNRVGGVTTDLGFLSTAKTQQGASNGGTHHEVLLILQSKTGKEIGVASIFGGEGEILFKPGARFKVTKTFKKNARNGWAGADPEIQTYLAGDTKKDQLKMVVIKEEV